MTDEPGTNRVYSQRGFSVRLGWGLEGLRALTPHVDAVVLVDVLSFSTSVDIAVSRGVTVFPYRWHDGTEHDYASSVGAVIADRAGQDLGLRPATLVDAPAGVRLVMPSPNGSTLTFAAGQSGVDKVIVGCIRNAEAVARALDDTDAIAVIAAGERWGRTQGPLRPAIEDQLGAGRIIRALGRSAVSPEALGALTMADVEDSQLRWMIGECVSGREKRVRYQAEDIDLATAIDVSATVPTLIGDSLTDGS